MTPPGTISLSDAVTPFQSAHQISDDDVLSEFRKCGITWGDTRTFLCDARIIMAKAIAADRKSRGEIIAADRQLSERGEAVAWAFESYSATNGGYEWQKSLTDSYGLIELSGQYARNIIPLYTHPTPAAAPPINWLPIETAPIGIGGLVTAPGYIEPPLVMLLFDNGKQAIGKWDWYYAEGGNGCIDGCAWVDDICGEVLSQYYDPPTHWQPLPEPPITPSAAPGEPR